MDNLDNKKALQAANKVQYNVIIIGGGLGGLTAGATLAKKGNRVLLLEQHYIPGGCATTFKRKDYVMEVGLHEIDGLYEHDAKSKIFEFLEVDKNINFVKIPEFYNVKSADKDFVVPHGKTNYINSLIARYPHEEAGIKKLVNTMAGVLKEISNFPSKRWVQLAIFPIMPFMYPNVLKTSMKDLGSWLDQNITDESLKLLLQANLAYYHDDPYTMSMLYFSTAQASYICGGGHFIQGGSQKLSNYLAEVIEQNGGKVALGKCADQIIVEGDKAVGVVFKDVYNPKQTKVKAYAQAVICNAAAPLIAKMLPSQYGEKLQRKLSKYQPACSLISIYLGFNKSLKEVGVNHYTTIIPGEDVKSIKDVHDNYKGAWSKKSFLFVDYGQINAKLAPSGKSVGVIASIDYLSNWENLDDDGYKVQKEKVANQFIDRLAAVYPGIRDCIDYYTVGTSKTINRYTLNTMGTPYGYAQIPSQSGLNRLQVRSQINNLYFASAWAFPGGGFTGAIIGGFQCALAVSDHLKNKSLEIVPYQDNRQSKVISKKIIARNTLELTIEKPNNFNFNAGQYAILKLHNMPNDAIDVSHRSLSIVSHPTEKNIRFAMRTGNSEFKKLCEALKEADLVSIYGPLGNLSVTDFRPVYTEKQGRINETKLKEVLANTQKTIFYIVGNNQFIKSMKCILINNGVKSTQIKIDDFG